MISLFFKKYQPPDRVKPARPTGAPKKRINTLFGGLHFLKRLKYTAKKMFNIHVQKECSADTSRTIPVTVEAEPPIAHTEDGFPALNVDSVLIVPSDSLLCRLSEAFSSSASMTAASSTSPDLPSEASFSSLQFASPSAAAGIRVYDVRRYQPVITQSHHEVNWSTATVDVNVSETKVVGVPASTVEDVRFPSMDAIRFSDGSSTTVVEDEGSIRDASTSKRGIITLRNKLSLDGPFDEKTAVLGIAQLLWSIYQMHLGGVIHCNINPDSIMVDDEGNFILRGFEHSVTFPGLPVPDRTSFPLYPDCPQNSYLVGRPVRYSGNAYIPSQAFLRGKASFNADYSALGYVYHEIRHGQGVLPVERQVGRRTVFELMKNVLSENEHDFIRRLVMSGGRGRFDSAEEMMQHPVFSEIDWDKFH